MVLLPGAILLVVGYQVRVLLRASVQIVPDVPPCPAGTCCNLLPAPSDLKMHAACSVRKCRGSRACAFPFVPICCCLDPYRDYIHAHMKAQLLCFCLRGRILFRLRCGAVGRATILLLIFIIFHLHIQYITNLPYHHFFLFIIISIS